jgi:hypothetical protein
MGDNGAYVLTCECPDTVLGVEGALIQWLADNGCHAEPDANESTAYLYVSEDCYYRQRMACEFTCEAPG